MRVKHMKALDLKFFALKKTVLAMDFIWMIMCIGWMFDEWGGKCVVFQKCTCPCKLYEPANRYSRNNRVFGRSAVMELLELKSSGASKFLSNLVQADDLMGLIQKHGNEAEYVKI